MRLSVTRFVYFLLLFTGGVWFTAMAYAQPSAAPVAVMLPEQSSLAQQLQLSGTVQALRQSNLSSRVDGAVAEILVDAGSEVAAGQSLMTLDKRLAEYEAQRLRAALAAAKAEAEEAARQVAEAVKLSKSQHLPATELALRRAAAASATAALQAAEAQLALQQQRLAFHNITAPFAGVVVERYTEAGEWVNRGTPVLQLVATEQVYLDVQVPQEQFAGLLEQSNITIRPDTQPDKMLAAELAASVPVADSASRSFRLRLISPEHQGLLLPGSSATATFTRKQQNQQVLTVSRDALLRNPDNSFALFVVKQNGEQALAERRQVKVGRVIGNTVEVLSGLAANEAVVIRGNEILRNQQPVSVQGGE